MHFKDFTEQFYQYPHIHLSYSQILRNHEESFTSFDRNLIDFPKTNQELQMVPQCTNTKRRFNGKTLRNIFTQLKNKTNSELEEYIDLGSLNNPTPETSVFTVQPHSYPNRTKVTAFHHHNSPKDLVVCKSTQAADYRRDGKRKDGMLLNPDVRICVDSQEFDHIEKSIKFVVCPKQQFESVPSDYADIRLGSHIEPRTVSSLKIKNEPELQEKRVFEVYNVLKRAISNVKSRYKKCKTSNNPSSSSNANSPVETIKPPKSQGASNSTNGTCKCVNSQKPDGKCSCWNKEDETLFCLLKMEARENFKQIKHIERELKLQKKALKFLNNRCRSLENIVKLRRMDPEAKLSKTNSDTDVQEIFVKDKQSDTQIARGQQFDSLEKADTSTSSPHFEEDRDIESAKIEEKIKLEEIVESKMKESPDLKSSDNLKITRIDSVKEIYDVKPAKRDDKSLPSSQSLSGSKIKITISRSTVVINTSTDEPTHSKTIILNKQNNQIKPKSIPANNLKEGEKMPCRCTPELIDKNKNCACPSNKSSFVLKLFRRQSCDSKCKCCTTIKTNKKKCKYFIEKKCKCPPKWTEKKNTPS